MQDKAITVEQYLSGLAEDRRRALEAVRQVMLTNLDKDYEEGMQYGVVVHYVRTASIPRGTPVIRSSRCLSPDGPSTGRTMFSRT